MGEIHFNIFYLTVNIQNIISAYEQYKKLTTYFIIFLLHQVFKSWCEFYT